MFLSLPLTAGCPVPGAEPDSWSAFTTAEQVTATLALCPSVSTAGQSLWSRGAGWRDPPEPAGGMREQGRLEDPASWRTGSALVGESLSCHDSLCSVS